MKIEFEVHRVSSHTEPAKVEFDGAKEVAEVRVLEVELTTVKPLNGTLTLRFTSSQMEEARATFIEGETIAGDFPTPEPAQE